MRISHYSDDRARFRRHVHLLRLLCRSLDLTVRVMHEGERVHLVDVLKIRPGCRGSVGVLDLPQCLGRSQSIGRRGQKEARTERLAPLTAFADGAWSFLPTGWEMQEHLDRERDRRERADALARIDLEWPRGGGERQDQLRRAALEELRSSWPEFDFARFVGL